MFCILLQTSCWHLCGVCIFVTQPLFAAMVDPSHAQRRRKINHDQDMDGNTSFDESLRSSFASVKQCELIFFKKRFQQLAPPVAASLVCRMTSTQSFVWDIFIILPKLYIFYKYFLNTGILTPSISCHFSFSLQLSDFTATEMSCNNPV